MSLRRFARPGAGPVRRCELCGEPLGEPHGHLVALDDRALRCVCRACHLLFAPEGAGRLRAIPNRYLTDPDHPLDGSDWNRLGIPALPVFVFVNSDLGRPVACCPSPAGTTESTVDPGDWAALGEVCPLFRMPAPDVEAIYVSRTPEGLDAALVPIDVCFALAGAIRLHWRGPDGGSEVRRALTTFQRRIGERARHSIG
ncbi:hypothetical protein GCM10010168_56580 [Actinoplanes ianthinogenes]|uniref:Uncharacterized protein n=1 Tax=Actinoplanes ianthinogenes TaxID=122358 RepID=A0ABM7M326_9ACTN|nr:DUF5947 family protein [Actinoplanes ianthinogenes]BCJ45922.1 hypothetical protein Aiant_65790 [Actinoplanes ianthinogenes]GGR31123.1 hypothetical protein GCM10010168_56580 [Actinoplanes ianthinogenes]